MKAVSSESSSAWSKGREVASSGTSSGGEVSPSLRSWGVGVVAISGGSCGAGVLSSTSDCDEGVTSYTARVDTPDAGLEVVVSTSLLETSAGATVVGILSSGSSLGVVAVLRPTEVEVGLRVVVG